MRMYELDVVVYVRQAFLCVLTKTQWNKKNSIFGEKLNFLPKLNAKKDLNWDFRDFQQESVILIVLIQISQEKALEIHVNERRIQESSENVPHHGLWFILYTL